MYELKSCAVCGEKRIATPDRTICRHCDPTVHKTEMLAGYQRKLDRLNAEFKKACVHCGETDIACLSLHHPDGTKEGNVATIIRARGYAEAAAEAAKCVCLCENCHRKLHAGRFTL